MPDCWTSCFALAMSPLLAGLPYGHCPVGWPIMPGGRKKHAGISVPEPRRFIALGTMLVIMYGPTPGGGSFGWFLNGVPLGTRPSDGNASTLSNAPYGVFRWIVILPVELSAVIPEIVLALPFENAVAPLIWAVR